MTSNSYYFSAFGQYLRTTNANGFPAGIDDFCVSLWFSPSNQGPASDYQIIFANQMINQFQLAVSPTDSSSPFPPGSLTFYTGDGKDGQGLDANCKSGPLSWETGHWYNIQIVRLNNFVTIYRDRTIVAEAQVPQGNDAPEPLRLLDLGFRSSNQNHQAYGRLDDIRIYRRALSLDELNALYVLTE